VRLAEKVLADGAADMVAMTRAHIADPFHVEKVRQGRDREIIRCVGANFCAARARDGLEVTCMMNPATGRERRWGVGTLVPAQTALRVAVVGGGPAGMKAAAIAARRGHEVILIERDEKLGGHTRLLATLPGRSDWALVADNLSREMETAGVDIRTAINAAPGLLRELEVDVIICATGARWDRTGYTPRRPSVAVVPGADTDHVYDLGSATSAVATDPAALGSRVLIFDDTGSYWPLGLAQLLAQASAAVTLVTPHLHQGDELVATLELGNVMPILMQSGVRVLAQHFLDEIADSTVTISDIWTGRQQRLENISSIVLCGLRVPDDDLYWQLHGSKAQIQRLGDALAPRSSAAVIYEGEEFARSL
jgi:hypothetical protein